MDETEFQERRPLNLLHRALPVGFRQAGQLNENAVVALRLDDRLRHAKPVHAFAQHFDRLRQGAFQFGYLIRDQFDLARSLVGDRLDIDQAVGVHGDQERRAALQIDAEFDVAGGLALQTAQDKRRGMRFAFHVIHREIVRDVVGPDGFDQIVVSAVRMDFLQFLGFMDDRGEGGVAVNSGVLENIR